VANSPINAGSTLKQVDEALNSMAEPGSATHKDISAGILRQTKGVMDAETTSSLQEVMSKSAIATAMEIGLTKGQTSLQSFYTLMNELAPYVTGSGLWAELGFPVIDLTYDFFHAIAFTDFGESDGEELKLPFDFLLLRFPENVVLGGARTAFIYRSFRLNGFEGGHVPLPKDIHLVWDRTRVTLARCNVGDVFTEWDHGVALKELMKGEAVSGNEKLMIQKPPREDEAAKVLSVLRRVIGNSMLYINANGGLPPKGVKKLGPDVPVEREHKENPRFRIGRPIKLGPQMRKMFTTSTARGTWKLAARFVVRGHWRNQAHGPNRELRKRMWIEPHWKGPEDVTEALERTYAVD